MSGDQIQVSRDGVVMTVTIANEAKRNALGTKALERIDALADEIAENDDIRAVILTGAGDKAFTSGFDLGELGDFKPENLLESRFSDAFEKWARLPVPVIGALNGHCMGGGVHVAVICDALVSVPGVRFMIPAARFGFVYNPASVRRITAMFGQVRASQMLYMNQEFVAEDLTAQGIIHRIVPNADLMQAARDMANRTAGLAPLSVAAMKEILCETPDRSRVEELVKRCAYSEDVVEGLTAIREKRSPAFQGK